MKSPKDVRRETEKKSVWAWVVPLVIAVIVASLIFWVTTPSYQQTTTRAAIAQLSKVQPGDTLYWFDEGVEPLAVIRNIPEQQVIETTGYEQRVVERKQQNGCIVSTFEVFPCRRFYSYNEVYQALVTIRERP